MKVEEVKVCILIIEGTNCEEETSQAFRRSGASPEIVHLKQLLGQDTRPEETRKLGDYQILVIPGGFSSGDYVRAGAILAARIKSRMEGALVEFIEEGKPVLGICNGFQILVELGVLPGIQSTMSRYPTASLGWNDSGRFECRPTLLENWNKGKCIFTSMLERGQIIQAPTAHAEGKFMLPKHREKELLDTLKDNDQIVFRYVDAEGQIAGYPWNPNGSLFSIAGICNSEGNVFGMMPHPERTYFGFQQADWTRNVPDNGDGKAVFESVLDYVAKKF
ncbi:MAG: phosphoribosylformylglycinamidine synthase subunit PurQ [Thermoplasmata archaeon]|nr:phosphoribosylformylglycinamidine synthase subunit PurQ [Thermoplasmata archaeon]